MYEKIYSKITDALVDDGYIVLENALDVSLAAELSQYVQTLEGFKKAGISTTADLHIDSTRRADKTFWIDKNRTKVEDRFLEFTQGLQEYLNRSLYLGLQFYEAHFALYEKDDFYEKHLDAFKNSKNRVVTTVYYLNESWNEKNGGKLIIFDKNDKEITKVTPNLNTLVVFMSEGFPHEVLPAKTKRYSIAGWYRVD